MMEKQEATKVNHRILEGICLMFSHIGSTSTAYYEISDESSKSGEQDIPHILFIDSDIPPDLPDEEAEDAIFSTEQVLQLPTKKTIYFQSDYKMNALQDFNFSPIQKPTLGLSQNEIR